MNKLDQGQVKQYVNRVLKSFSVQPYSSINDSMINALECLPFDYGTHNYNKICNAVIAELKERAGK